MRLKKNSCAKTGAKSSYGTRKQKYFSRRLCCCINSGLSHANGHPLLPPPPPILSPPFLCKLKEQFYVNLPLYGSFGKSRGLFVCLCFHLVNNGLNKNARNIHEYARNYANMRRFTRQRSVSFTQKKDHKVFFLFSPGKNALSPPNHRLPFLRLFVALHP